MALKWGERVCMLTALDHLAPAHRLVIVRQASNLKELQVIARDTAAGPALSLLGE